MFFNLKINKPNSKYSLENNVKKQYFFKYFNTQQNNLYKPQPIPIQKNTIYQKQKEYNVLSSLQEVTYKSNYTNNLVKNIDSIQNINYIFDHIYIISLKKCNMKREMCINQLLKYNIKNYEFYDAVDVINDNHYNVLYETIINQFDKTFIKYNFQKGALGCLLSHLNVIKLAKKNGYNSILILEDDCIFKNNFNHEYLNVINYLPNNWDFIYLGKKQTDPFVISNNLKHIYPESKQNIKNPIKINDIFYKPNYFTYASHAWCIKNTIYDDLIKRYTMLDAPVDLMVMQLLNKYNFYALYDDLFITSFESDIRTTTPEIELNKWKWDLSKYFNINSIPIKNIVIWGFETISHTHHYIHKMYYDFFKLYYNNLNVLWCSDNLEKNTINNFENTLFFTSPTHGHYNNLPINSTSLYIIHLDNFSDNVGLSINSFMKMSKYNEIINTNRYIILLAREQITSLKYFDCDHLQNYICLPWFCNKKYYEIMNIKNNVKKYYNRNKQNANFCYMGSIWYLNEKKIKELIDSCIIENKPFLFSGRVHKGVNINMNHKLITQELFYNKKSSLNSNEDTIERLNNLYGVKAIIPIQGNEHNNNYISNRLIECICEGYIGVSNNIIVNRLIKHVYYNDNIHELIKYISNLLENEEEYCNILNKQVDEILSKYYGYYNINNLLTFIQQSSLKNNMIFSLNNYTNKTYTLLFSNSNYSDYSDYIIIDNIISFNSINCIKSNYIIKENEYDIFMIDKILKYIDYDVVINHNYKYKDQLIEQCIQNNKKWKIKHPLKIYCLFSSQRTGSTLIVDYIQKTSKKVLALSEIFEENYLTSYDIINKNGILYNTNIFPLNKDLSNIKEYFQQFINIANDYEVLFFKYTFDMINIFDTSNINKIINIIQQFNIIYLDRNDIDIFISKQLAEQNNSYSNDIYIKNVNVNLKEYYKFLNKKHAFLNDNLSQLNRIKYVNYNFIKENNHFSNITEINKILNSFYESNEEYLIYEEYYEFYNIFNKKQNKFNNNNIL